MCSLDECCRDSDGCERDPERGEAGDECSADPWRQRRQPTSRAALVHAPSRAAVSLLRPLSHRFLLLPVE